MSKFLLSLFLFFALSLARADIPLQLSPVGCTGLAQQLSIAREGLGKGESDKTVLERADRHFRGEVEGIPEAESVLKALNMIISRMVMSYREKGNVYNMTPQELEESFTEFCYAARGRLIVSTDTDV